jgi:Fic family protein
MPEFSVFEPPKLNELDREVLRLIDELRGDMSSRVGTPRRWYGSLRRMTLARAVQGSNSIEGYHASLDDVAAAVEGEPTLDANEETRLALAGYRDAMTYVLQTAKDEQASAIDEGLVKSLHFMMIKHDLGKGPGRWRHGDISVQREEDEEIVYTGPDADIVPGLIAAMLGQLNQSEECPLLVRAAMAHLNLVMIHPFRDGNGRMGRCLQSLVLAREGIDAPVFSSIEEYLGRNTQDYYDVLAEVGQGAWNPHNSSAPWVRFCLTAHYRQAKTHLRRIEEIEEVWRECVNAADEHDLPERTAAGMLDAAMGLRLRNMYYRNIVESATGDEITDLTASRDLKAMVDAKLLRPVGANRGRYYLAAEQLVTMREGIRVSRPPREDYDPFVVAANGMQMTLPT